jgi:CheY-like chemotaxis protein
MNSPNFRVLVVEDREDLRDGLVRHIRRLGPRVWGVGTREDAIAQAERISFHLAVVDIMLSNDYNDRGGLEVIKFIKSLEEGTRCIAVSQSPHAEVPVRAMEIGIDKYILKADIKSPKDYLHPINETLKTAKLSEYGCFDNLFAYLAAPTPREIWEANAINVLGTNAEIFASSLNEALESEFPALRGKAGNMPIQIDRPSGTLSGVLWSRVRGEAIEFQFGRGGLSGDAQGSPIRSRTKGAIKYEIASRPDISRHEFLDRMQDIR